MPSCAGSTPYNCYGSARLDAQKDYADTQTTGNAWSLLFPFHASGVAGRRSRCALLTHGPARTSVITWSYRLHVLSS
jgi:hypothetical protein